MVKRRRRHSVRCRIRSNLEGGRCIFDDLRVAGRELSVTDMGGVSSLFSQCCRTLSPAPISHTDEGFSRSSDRPDLRHDTTCIHMT